MQAITDLSPAAQSLNRQLADPTPIEARYGVFTPAGASYSIVSYDKAVNVGVAKSVRTGACFAFSVSGDAKPVACRDYRAEFRVELLEIDTVAVDGGIAAEIGSKVAGRWLSPWFSEAAI